ncbi:hypothetical protein [Krasilnikoviella flava]|uniref:Uncharacterized protein n=1 Tax=Krasilnikoviella flava TaxID=526729 RepID=A0A1T5JMK6_9MICO|nr:hypothetical protein [Krasilnikoviella flava]SKC52777.1 hypothetical protein SAMN04324258_1569 [Krasilnikoviella flava]
MPALRLSDALARLGMFAGPLPAPAPAGRFARPEPPADLVAALDALAPALRARVLDPLGRDAPSPVPGRPRTLSLPSDEGVVAPARQVDERTCGSAVLTMLALAGDPRQALELSRRPRGAAASFAAAQRALHARTTRGPGGLPAWPAGLGTPPWGAARVARYGRVRYTHRVVGGRSAPQVLVAAAGAAAAGVPVPLYTGGDLSRGAATAVPRHVVLLTAVRGGLATLYEPSAGRLHAVPVAGLLAPGGPGSGARRLLAPALGGWPHVVWALLPRDARG